MGTLSSQIGPCSNLPDSLIRAWIRVASHRPLTADTAIADKVGCVNQALDRWLGLATGRPRPGSNPAAATSLRTFGNSVYLALPLSFGGDTKSRRSLLSGVYARGSKRSHQSALACVTVVDSTTHSKTSPPHSGIGVLPCIGPCQLEHKTRRPDNFKPNCPPF